MYSAHANINTSLRNLWTYCNLLKLKLNTNKTVYPIFSRRYKVEKSVKIRYGGEEIQKDDAPQYLGLQLDQKLSMRKHIENTAAKARRRLNIVKKLASTKWGANKQTRQVYMGYIRPTMECSSAALSTATHTHLASLDKVQNQALRFISGAMKTTPASACGIDCNIEPLDIRRDAAIVTTYERYQRLEHHPNKALIQTWSKKTRFKQQSYLTRATTLLPEYNLPCSREKIATVAPQPLYRTSYQPTLCPHLIVKSASKAYPAHILEKLGSRDHRHVSKHNDACLHRWIGPECGGARRIWSNHPIPRCKVQRLQ